MAADTRSNIERALGELRDALKTDDGDVIKKKMELLTEASHKESMHELEGCLHTLHAVLDPSSSEPPVVVRLTPPPPPLDRQRPPPPTAAPPTPTAVTPTTVAPPAVAPPVNLAPSVAAPVTSFPQLLGSGQEAL